MTDRQRWAEAAPRMAMALSEAGYPTTFWAVSFYAPNRENELEFATTPPDDVLRRAGELCGVADLIELFIEDREPLDAA